MISRWIHQSGLFAILILLSMLSANAAPPQGYRFLSLDHAIQQASNEGKPVLLYFGRYGCSACRKMHAEVFTDSALASRLNAEFVLAYVDTESAQRIQLGNGEIITEMQYATRNRILGTPTFVFFSPAQKPLFKKAGYQTLAQLNRYADYVVEQHYQSVPLDEYLAAQ